MPDQLQTLAIPILSIANNTDYTDHMNTETMLAAGFWEGGKGMAVPYSIKHGDL